MGTGLESPPDGDRARITIRALSPFLALTLAGAAAAFDAQGHRGARGLAPENTLPAFAAALGIGVSTLEMDAGVTRDGVVVVSHDPRLSARLARDTTGRRVADPGPAIRSLDRTDLAAYDVGRVDPDSDYAKRFPLQRPHDGARVPALAEVIALAARAGNRSVRFNVETKIRPDSGDLAPSPDAFADAVVAALRAGAVAARSTVQSFDWRTLRRVRETAPEIGTVCLTAEQRWLDSVQRGRPGPSPWTAGLDVDDLGGSVPRLVAAAGCGTWSPYHRDLTAAALEEAQGIGLAVVTWTVNAPGDMERLIDLGVDGVITDYPDRLRAVMAGRGMPLPPATPVAP